MSSLKWQTAAWLARVHGGETLYGWELVHEQPKGTAFDPYYLPAAEIRKLKDRQWQLYVTGEPDPRYFKTLKEAKAMGIALYRMGNDG